MTSQQTQSHFTAQHQTSRVSRDEATYKELLQKHEDLKKQEEDLKNQMYKEVEKIPVSKPLTEEALLIRDKQQENEKQLIICENQILVIELRWPYYTPQWKREFNPK